MREKRRGRPEWAVGATCPKRHPGGSWSLNADVRSLHLRQILRVSGKTSGKISPIADDRTSEKSFVTFATPFNPRLKMRDDEWRDPNEGNEIRE